MNSFSIALKMFRTNLKSYGFYLAVMIFAIAVYYDFMVLKYSPDFLKAKDAVQAARIASSVTSFILVVFLFFFIWYSSSFFLKQRKKEIAIYSLTGVSNRKIGRIFAIESLFTGITSIIAGLGTGILFSRLFLMAVAKVALLDVSVGFTVPANGIKELLIVFGIIFLIMSAGSFINVSRSKLIDLIRDSSKEEKEPKFKAVRAILSIIFIGAGYYLSRYIALELFVVIIVVIGTYWLFGALLPSITKFLTNRKSILYKGVRIISISNISFRIKANYRVLAMVAVMTATTITAFGTSLSIKYYVDETQYINYPYSFSYVQDNAKIDDKVIDTIKSSKHKLLLNEKIEFIKLKSIGFANVAIKYSDFVKISNELKKQYPGRIPEYKTVSGKNALVVMDPASMVSFYSYEGKKVKLSDSKGNTLSSDSYTIFDQLKSPLFGISDTNMSDCIIVSDEEYAKLTKLLKPQVFHGLIVSDAKDSTELAKSLYHIMPKNIKLFTYVESYTGLYAFMGLFYFLGSFMSIIFIFATGSIMFFKILSEGLADKGKYTILRKIGMTRIEIKKAVSMQVGLSLILPLAVGVVHSLFAIAALKTMLGISLVIPTITAIGIYVLFYAAFYAATTRKFMKMVY
jgi:putative ABC transport system permease protein